ncbi:MAG: hypothetical protein ACQEXJ_01095 [Myxococcota bacterium]
MAEDSSAARSTRQSRRLEQPGDALSDARVAGGFIGGMTIFARSDGAAETRPMMRGRTPGTTFLLALLVVVLSGCALPRPKGPAPLYDFDTVWLNDGVGGVRPWRRRNRERITAAAVRQQDRREGRDARSRTRLAEAERKPKREPARKRPEKAPKQKAPKQDPAPERTAQRDPPDRREPAARVEPKEPEPDPPPPEDGGRPLLGDGSVPGELLAAARRMVGIREGFGEGTFLEHLLTVAAVDMDVAAPRARFDAAVLARFERAGRTFVEQGPEPGDLAFFRIPRGDDARIFAAVVERVRDSGVVVCIGEVHGEVRRFVADPARPWVRRDDRTGEVVNAPLRRRTFQDDPDAPALAGALFATWARP